MAELFRMLPEEVWEIILGHLNSLDILNMFRAFPNFVSRLMRNSQVWLIDQVAPFVFAYLGQDDIRNARLVNRRWAQGFEHFLEGRQPSPDRNPSPSPEPEPEDWVRGFEEFLEDREPSPDANPQPDEDEEDAAQ